MLQYFKCQLLERSDLFRARGKTSINLFDYNNRETPCQTDDVTSVGATTCQMCQEVWLKVETRYANGFLSCHIDDQFSINTLRMKCVVATIYLTFMVLHSSMKKKTKTKIDRSKHLITYHGLVFWCEKL